MKVNLNTYYIIVFEYDQIHKALEYTLILKVLEYTYILKLLEYTYILKNIGIYQYT